MAKANKGDRKKSKRIVAKRIDIVDSEGRSRLRLEVDKQGNPSIEMFDARKKMRLSLYVDDDKQSSQSAFLIRNLDGDHTVQLFVNDEGDKPTKSLLSIKQVTGENESQTYLFPNEAKPAK
jgi:hypothetical protein